MDSGHGTKRMNVEDDRLSSLPDDLIHKILSFLKITEAIGNNVLSPRWRYIWTSMPYLSFTSQDFSTLPKFSKFVTHFLSARDNLTDVYSVKLSFRGKASQVFVKRILNYAFSHNVQQLNVVCLHHKDIELPLSLFSSQSLKHLSLMAYINRGYHYFIIPTSTWELPALTTLDLHYVTLCDDEADKCVAIFSKCSNLKNLTLKHFKTMGSNGFSISHPRLSNLTLESSNYKLKVVNVSAPQLENLTIRFCRVKLVISAPELVSFFYNGSYPLRLSTDGFHSLENAHISVCFPGDENAQQLACLLQHLHNVKFLELNLEMVEILSSSVDQILHQPSPFINLKSLKIYPRNTFYDEQAPKKVAMSNELKSYLLDGSSESTFTMVLREEIQAQNIMDELRVILEKEKDDNSKTNRAHVDQGETPAKKLKIGMAQIKSCWENLDVQIYRRKEKVCEIISKLQRVEELLANLPASNKAKIQQRFSILCTEADIAISKITDCMKIQCDESQSRSSLRFRELVTTLKTSS
ncbi:F-box/LRR-repeat protein At3g26922-like [Bidens hawaiensis]|uniref:F-box/LRR-repeat protein At3g26922-like n=1 Tax=Bidens hawaiensis TaxID=980011 RepID=UPI0040496222